MEPSGKFLYQLDSLAKCASEKKGRVRASARSSKR